MLEQLAFHGGMDIVLEVEGDLHVDEHHTIEDTAITIGQALRKAVSRVPAIKRYGFTLPMEIGRAHV